MAYYFHSCPISVRRGIPSFFQKDPTPVSRLGPQVEAHVTILMPRDIAPGSHVDLNTCATSVVDVTPDTTALKVSETGIGIGIEIKGLGIRAGTKGVPTLAPLVHQSEEIKSTLPTPINVAQL